MFVAQAPIRYPEVMSRDEIIRIPPSERLALIAELWDSLNETELTLTTAQQDEIQRRLDSFEADRTLGTTWEELRDEVSKRTA